MGASNIQCRILPTEHFLKFSFSLDSAAASSCTRSAPGGGNPIRGIHEVSKFQGGQRPAAARYDTIGLLPPIRLAAAGYRLYDDTALARLQSILLFRELEFPLKDIKRILDDPNFDPAAAPGALVHFPRA